MRYLHLADICIDTQNQVLIRAGVTINLAPKVYELLLYFLQNSERVLSKDELMEQVWSGSFVTDNAISRTLVKVRKALNDDPKSPEFIITVPRKGYRMQGKVVQSEFLQPEHSPHRKTALATPKSSSFKRNILTALALAAISLLAVFLLNSTNTSEILSGKQLLPLTRATGTQMYPSISPDSTQVAYTSFNAQTYLKQLTIEHLTNKENEIISHARGNLSKPVWSPDGKKIAFLYQHNVVCMIFWATVEGLSNKDNWQTISECGSKSQPSFHFSPDGKQFYLNDRQTELSGYQIFRVNLNDLTKDIVNQPITNGLGNYSFDISPNGKHLVMLNSEYEPETRIYHLDIENSTLVQTARLDYLMRSVIWHHDSQTLIHPSPHPAYELWQSNLQGEKIAVVASTPTRIRHLRRVNNNQDFVFNSYLLDRDIHYRPMNEVSSTKKTPMANSSVMDYLPALANNSDLYAFASKRSNKAEIYLAQLGKSEAKQLTNFDNPIKLYHIAFSPNDSQLLVLADNHIYLIDLITEKMRKLPIENKGVSGISWQDEQSLLLSVVKNNDWQLMQYQVNTQSLTPLDSGYQAGLYSQQDQHYYFLSDENNQVLKLTNIDSTPEPLALFCTPSFINRKLNLKVTSKGIVCHSDEIEKGLSYFEKQTSSIKPWINIATTSDFELRDKGIIYANIKQQTSDIMRTTSQ